MFFPLTWTNLISKYNRLLGEEFSSQTFFFTMAIPLNEVLNIHQGVLDLQNSQKTLIHQMETILAMAAKFWWMIVSTFLELCKGKRAVLTRVLLAVLVANY